MPHIEVQPGLAGIRALLLYRQDTAKPLNELVELLLRGPSSLSPGERELIATYVSSLNECKFCTRSHAAIARHLLSNDPGVVDAVMADLESAPVPEKLKSLLSIAGQVQKEARRVLPSHIERARRSGASDREIHDTVLIAAAFCMFNRYVDGLGAWTPEELGVYDEIGARIAEEGYLGPSAEHLQST